MTAFVAPAHWQAIDLLSDVHLAPEAPHTFQAWARHLESTSADAVFILGDLFEVWIGDDDDDPFNQQCLQVLQRAASRLTLAFLAGNRDFLLGETALRAVPMTRLEEPVHLEAWGQSLVLGHGDAWCLQDHAYQAFRAQVRGAAWQQAFLSQPLRQRREQARSMREASQARRLGLPDPQLWADVDAQAACQVLEQAGARTLVHGHTHRPAVHELGAGRQRWVLSDWDLDSSSPRADLLRLSRAGLTRLPPQLGAQQLAP